MASGGGGHEGQPHLRHSSSGPLPQPSTNRRLREDLTNVVRSSLSPLMEGQSLASHLQAGGQTLAGHLQAGGHSHLAEQVTSRLEDRLWQVTSKLEAIPTWQSTSPPCFLNLREDLGLLPMRHLMSSTWRLCSSSLSPSRIQRLAYSSHSPHSSLHHNHRASLAGARSWRLTPSCAPWYLQERDTYHSSSHFYTQILSSNNRFLAKLGEIFGPSLPSQ